MGREDFLKGLENALSGMPPEEIQEAVEFYREYLDEAGPENESEVLKSLGSPASVAAGLRADVAVREYNAAPHTTVRRGIGTIWLLILALLASPVALPVTIALIAVIVALVVVAVVMLLVIFVAAGSSLVSGFWRLITIFTLASGGADAILYAVGGGITAIGMSLLLFVAGVMLSRLAFRGLVYLVGKLSRKR